MRMNKSGLRVAIALAVLVGLALLATAAGSNAPASVSQKFGIDLPSSGASSAVSSAGASQAAQPFPKAAANGVTTVAAVWHGESRPLRDITPVAANPRTDFEVESPVKSIVNKALHVADPVLQNHLGPSAMPTPILSFEGMSNHCDCLPPDTNGDVGPNNYVQVVNTHIQIWDKNGNSLYGPVSISTLWAGQNNACATRDDGDPIALYDPLANRWLISQFAFTPSFPQSLITYQCIAISQTGDPTGAYHLYQFEVSPDTLQDYPHFGVWPDGYYMSANEFRGNYPYLHFVGQSAFAFDRNAMLNGQPANMQYFHLDPPFGGQLPTDFDGTLPPPAGMPNLFIERDDDAEGGFPADSLQIFRFHVDWSNPANSSFTGPTALNTAPFDANLCNYNPCIHQPGTSTTLDPISDKTMYRVAYRNFGDHESIVLNHTVDTNGADLAGIRWYELRNVSSNPTIYQQGTFAPDGDNRWMGSIALDQSGNIALGYSVSSSSTFPTIRYTGRLSTDPPGQMPQGESTLVFGGGIQTNRYARWGDYSDLTVDPSDGCTFWYTQEYYATTSDRGWQTRIGTFKFPGCGVPPTPTASPTPCTAGSFSDVPPGSAFYGPVTCLAGRGIVSGYSDCTFRPSSPVTRGQLAKIVANSAGFNETPTTQHFVDIPPGSPFYLYVERLATRNVISGYACGGNGEPCPGTYFRQNAPVSRGQTSKIVASAANLTPPSPYQQTFQDVPVGSTFWTWIESLASAGTITGYPCGGAGEPCVPPGNKPYFRPNADVSRGQSSKIVASTFFPGCSSSR